MTAPVEVQVVEGLVVRPGDRLLLAVGDLRADVVEDMVGRLRERFPDVEVTVMGGNIEMTLIKGDDDG